MVRVGTALGAPQTGVSLYELAPGTSNCPYHYEYAEEEWAMPLDGPVTLRVNFATTVSGRCGCSCSAR
ncbi:MAG: hypothetical protein H7287_09880 [Thermoleophilia bacterium]|nr:hypothetical protein [Thermoleophilia bacterium]